ncbi:IclR family transcriptional regulator [Paraburkholderia silviterrae]|uniref:IclR family transcriptional regulator n=1 Tax=Paraburkholderia silviterrae TaxID=2528715 RepID=A0A4R5M5L0_9BURK|nr:IclR family transcriptional regulator [Paraburkholderia silviterrae]TDG21235.1 IclR family transcriptional regulator [Paraburkholderia silviterrae]
MPRPTQVTLTLDRGLQILRAFHADRAPLTNGELASRTGLSRSSVSRFTSTLIHEGYIRRVAGGPQFELTMGVFAIGQSYLATSLVTQLAQPLMQRLADRLGVSVALAVPDQLDMLYIAYQCGARISTLQLGVGSLLPMGTTAIGRAWLGGLSESMRGRYIARLLAAAGPHAEALRAGIETAQEDLRSDGVCMSAGEYQRNAYGIALPIRLQRAQTLMALSCGAVETKLDIDAARNRIVPELRQTAVELESLLCEVEFKAP